MINNQKNQFPKIIHQSWKNDNVVGPFKKWSETWKKFNKGYEYRLWTDDDNLRLISEHFPEFLQTYKSYNHNIKRADSARPAYMYKYGGIYADLDFECLKSFDELTDKYAGYSAILGYMGEDRAFSHCMPNAIMISKPGFDFWTHYMDVMKDRANGGGAEFDTGPVALKDAYDSYQNKQKIAVLDSHFFYPLNWSNKKHEDLRYRGNPIWNGEDGYLTTGDKAIEFSKSYAVTYWTGVWKEKSYEYTLE